MLVKNIKIALAVTISLSFLCLAQTACKIGPANPPDKPTSSSTPTKSGRKHGNTVLTSSKGTNEASSTLVLEEKTRNNGTFTLELKNPLVNTENCFITVKIKPKPTDIGGKLSITPSITDEGGNVEGKFWWAVGKNNNGSYKYKKNPDPSSKFNTRLNPASQKNGTYSFRLKFSPGVDIQQGKVYNLTVKVELGDKTITKNTSWKKK